MNKNYKIPAPQGERGEEIGGLVRHLKARLEEFDCVTLEQCSQETGEIQVQFQGFTPKEIALALAKLPGIDVAIGENTLGFFLQKSHSHAMNDSIWGGLYRYICIETKEENT